jgi:hypothetical protein
MQCFGEVAITAYFNALGLTQPAKSRGLELTDAKREHYHLATTTGASLVGNPTMRRGCRSFGGDCIYQGPVWHRLP